MRRIIELGKSQFEVLRVPWYAQNDADWLCVVYSLKMVMDFYKNIHDNPIIRNRTPNTDRDELIRITNAQYGFGTTVGPTLIKRLSEAYPSMLFELKGTTLDEIKISIDNNFPVIVVYNPSFLAINEKGPAHAGVVVAVTEDKIILQNPWYGAGFVLDSNNFENAWELESNWGIFIKPNPQYSIDESNANKTS